MNNILSKALKNAQDQVTGLMKPKYHDKYIPAIKQEDTVICLEIGNLLGLSTAYMADTNGHYIAFPENKTLSEMMDKPLEFQKWYKENIPA